MFDFIPATRTTASIIGEEKGDIFMQVWRRYQQSYDRKSMIASKPEMIGSIEMMSSLSHQSDMCLHPNKGRCVHTQYSNPCRCSTKEQPRENIRANSLPQAARRRSGGTDECVRQSTNKKTGGKYLSSKGWHGVLFLIILWRQQRERGKDDPAAKAAKNIDC